MFVKRFCQFFNHSKVKTYIHRTYTCIISVCIIKSMRRSTFVFGSTSNSNKLDEKVKIVVK